MLIWNPSKLTEAGKALLAQAQAGQTAIHITKAQTGSGSYSGSENLEQRTALKAPKQTFPISDKEISATNTLILKIAITNKGSDLVSLQRAMTGARSCTPSQQRAHRTTCRHTTESFLP